MRVSKQLLNHLRKSILTSLVFTLSFLTAQNSKIDSLKLVIKNAKHDTTRINAFLKIGSIKAIKQHDSAIFYFNAAKIICEKNINTVDINNVELNKSLRKLFLVKYGYTLENIAWSYMNKSDPPKSIDYFKEAEKVYTEADNKLGIAKTYYGIGAAYYQLGETDKALAWDLKSLELKEMIGDKKQIVNSLMNLGILYAQIGKVKDAFATFDKSLKLSESIHDKLGIGGALVNLGILYSSQGQKEEALNNFRQNLKIRQTLNDKKGIANSFENIASIYADLRKFDTALYYLNQSFLIYTELDNKRGIVNTLKNQASIYTEKGEYEKATSFLKNCLVIAEKSNNKEFINWSYSGIAKNFIRSNRFNDALIYSQKSFKLAQELGFVEETQTAADQLQTIYQKLGNYKKAFEMYQLSIKLQDSLNNDENKKTSFKTKLKYDYDKKTLADSIRTASEKKLSAAKLAESTARLKQEKTQRLALIGGLILLLGFSVFTFNRFKNSQKQKRIIELQKKLVDESQKKTIDSINYAKKIQNSILPSTQEIGIKFPHHFIFYKPKDIVSGDFYWYHHENNLSFFAVADCTGHGVPGAFMTMIAHSILIEVVVEKKITAPDKILKSLHALIFKNLQQQKGDEYSQDGMDLSLAIIDHKNNLIHFSAARNHAFLINHNEVRTLKATQKSIGGLSLLGEIEPEREFKAESFQINPGSFLVLTTDGIFDQMSKQDEKFGTERFKEMILSLNPDNPTENLKVVESTYYQWKGETSQLDDILLLGVKL